MDAFKRTAAQRSERRPHLYAVAELAHRSVQQQRCSASVIVSGESGAGKTEASKHLLRYLSWRAGGTSGSSGIASRILHSTPVFEAFGNARTPFNDNSSRFGKHMEVLHSPPTQRAAPPDAIAIASTVALLFTAVLVPASSWASALASASPLLPRSPPSSTPSSTPGDAHIGGQHCGRTRAHFFAREAPRRLATAAVGA